MAQITICDICKQNVDKIGKIPSWVKLTFKYKENKSDWLERYKEVELCDFCFDKMMKIIKDGFVDYSDDPVHN